MKVLEKFESAIDALDQSRIEKARDTLKEGMDLVLHQIKLVRIADKSEFGWETVNKYETDELASDSEGDKRIYRLERRAEEEETFSNRDCSTCGRQFRNVSHSVIHVQPSVCSFSFGRLLHLR